MQYFLQAIFLSLLPNSECQEGYSALIKEKTSQIQTEENGQGMSEEDLSWLYYDAWCKVTGGMVGDRFYGFGEVQPQYLIQGSSSQAPPQSELSEPTVDQLEQLTRTSATFGAWIEGLGDRSMHLRSYVPLYADSHGTSSSDAAAAAASHFETANSCGAANPSRAAYIPWRQCSRLFQ